MRRLFLPVLACCAFLFSNSTEAQSINNKSWKAWVDGPISDTVVIHIYGDSSTVTDLQGQVKLRLHCKVSSDTLLITDTDQTDMSCENITGVYSILLKEEGFSLNLIADACDGRSFVLTNRKWMEVKKK